MTLKQQKIVDWCESKIKEKCGYIMGASGQICTPAFRQQQAKTYSSYDGNPNYGQEMIMGVGKKWDNRPVYDCQGYVRKALETIGVIIRSGATTQYNNAKKSYLKVESVSRIPSGGIAGAQLWRQSKTNAAVMSHTAICLGDGKVAEAQGTNQGVVKNSNLSTYDYYGIPDGLLDASVTVVDIPKIENNEKPPISHHSEIGNECAIGITVKGGVNMRQIPGGEYMLKIPEFTDIEISEYREVDGKQFGKTTFAAPSGKYKGDLYTGWVETRFVQIATEGESFQPIDKHDPASIIWTFFKGWKIPNNAIAGIMGNIYAESAFMSNNLQNSGNKTLGLSDEEYTAKVDAGSYGNFVTDKYGYGLCQWTHSSRKEQLLQYATAQKTSIADIDMQLRFMWKEMKGYLAMMGTLDASNVSIKDASDSFMVDFLRPANQSEANKAIRAAYSQQCFDKYAGK